MNARYSRQAPARAAVAPLHRGPGAMSHVAGVPLQHAPNAALLIDFDNVTMGIRSDLQTELRNLLSSDIIQGKVAVQRAYADWRRYPQYIVPLSESSIDLIFAPAYGSSKKNATDIRLAIDALELVFTRPEIGIFILLSGDSDFSSLVIKLKEYGKYVIGVGIRESSSDLLVQNCDEYYSYNALAGLVKSGDEDLVKYDPWELVVEAIDRMAKNGEVMRSDRLKQVMQDIDPSFDEKELGYSKFSRFCLEAARRGLLSVNRLENGQFEVVPMGAASAVAAPAVDSPAAAEREAEEEERASRRRGRSRRGRRPREDRPAEPATAAKADVAGEADQAAPQATEAEQPPRSEPRPPRPEQPAPTAPTATPAAPAPQPSVPEEVVIGRTGERLTRSEAFDLVRRAVESLVSGDETVSARDVRPAAFKALGRDSESLSERNFPRILKDAHDANIIDLRRRGDDYEVALAASATPITDQLNRAAAAAVAATPATHAAVAPRGMGHRGGGGRGPAPRGKLAAPPPELLNIGIVETVESPLVTPPTAGEAEPVKETAAAAESTAPAVTKAAPAPRKSTAKRGAKRAAKRAPTASKAAAAEPETKAPEAETVTKVAAASKATGKSTARKTGRTATKKAARTTARKAPASSAAKAAAKSVATGKTKATDAAAKSASAPAKRATKRATKPRKETAPAAGAEAPARSAASPRGGRKSAGTGEAE